MSLRVAGVLSLFFMLPVPSSHVTAQSSDAAFAFGNRHAVALRTNGELLTWGENVSCQLGRGSKGNSGRTPVVVMRASHSARVPVRCVVISLVSFV
jgi:alpha-tubulin suppressor-like RCC1 family protein